LTAQAFDRSRLCPVLLEISAITAKCHIWRSPHNHRCGGLISFTGIYHHGSAGVDDARYIRWALRQFLELARVDGLVIDCTGLDYQWGDDLDFPVNGDLPFCVVVQPDQRQAYAYAVSDSALRTDLHAELAAMAEAIRAMKSRL
jgi:hypothetical protein